ncbi:MAG: FHA domain-containing protein, partial [Acidobacteriota bacterium]|nr:FHA domain-containing protein [Acidobacteriota bacterium]
IVSDTGSTNGTFINGERIAYGRAFPVGAGDKLKFGTVEVALEHLGNVSESAVTDSPEIGANAGEKSDFSGEQTLVLDSSANAKIGQIPENVAPTE